MQPTKRRNSSDPLLCGAPAKKVPEPPVSNEDSNKPSLLKAFEAVVAAGKRGLLGPTAMAAVEAMPDLDLECRDGKVGQETPSSTPLVEEKKEEKVEEKKDVYTECNIVIAVTPPMKGSGSWQPIKQEIWVCGNSVILKSSKRAKKIFHGLRLGFPDSAANICWRGISTMLWDNLLPILHHNYHTCPFPSIIVIHLGERDLLIDSNSSLVTRMQNDLNILRSAFPDVVIIWSSLLPKHFLKPPGKLQIVESERNNVNCKMEEYCNKTGVCYLAHPLITGENKCLFLPDNSLSNAGADIFIIDLKKVLNTYLDHNQF